MSKYLYPFIAWDGEDYRFIGLFAGSREAAAENDLKPGETAVSRIPLDEAPPELVAEYLKQDVEKKKNIWHRQVRLKGASGIIDLLTKQWNDKPTEGQKTLFIRGYLTDPAFVKEAAERANALEEKEVRQSRWAALYTELDRHFPRSRKEIPGW